MFKTNKQNNTTSLEAVINFRLRNKLGYCCNREEEEAVQMA